MLSRRSLVALGMLALAGCAPRDTTIAMRTPDPLWPERPQEPGDGAAGGEHAAVAPAQGAGSAGNQGGSGSAAGGARADAKGSGAEGGGAAAPAEGRTADAVLRRGPVPFAIARSAWARGDPVVRKMDPMLPPRWITVHHDGMTPFLSEEEDATKARLDQIRRGHLMRDEGWGDIGYHFVVDRAGRVWEGRSLRFQGAHVKWCNEHNVGVMCLGNFEEQQPSPAQIAALERTLVALRVFYGIPGVRVRTHREWPTARTLCPGASLQAQMVVLRRNAVG